MTSDNATLDACFATSERHELEQKLKLVLTPDYPVQSPLLTCFRGTRLVSERPSNVPHNRRYPMTGGRITKNEGHVTVSDQP